MGYCWRIRSSKQWPKWCIAGQYALNPTSVQPQWKKQLQMGANAKEASEQAAIGTEPTSDINASVEYRKHLARVLVKRGLEEAGL